MNLGKIHSIFCVFCSLERWTGMTLKRIRLPEKRAFPEVAELGTKKTRIVSRF
jgi:hypothetical protein